MYEIHNKISRDKSLCRHQYSNPQPSNLCLLGSAGTGNTFHIGGFHLSAQLLYPYW